ncbi:MAG: winged helix-turn-helix transcriptional regulator [Lactobacillus sp.]
MTISVDNLNNPEYRDWAKQNDCVLGALFTIDLLRGKWKLFLLYQLSCGTKRFNELLKRCDNISESVLARKLNELQKDGLISKKIYPEIPPHTDYSLTPKGELLMKVINDLNQFGDENIDDVQTLRKQLS